MIAVLALVTDFSKRWAFSRAMNCSTSFTSGCGTKFLLSVSLRREFSWRRFLVYIIHIFRFFSDWFRLAFRKLRRSAHINSFLKIQVGFLQWLSLRVLQEIPQTILSRIRLSHNSPNSHVLALVRSSVTYWSMFSVGCWTVPSLSPKTDDYDHWLLMA